MAAYMILTILMICISTTQATSAPVIPPFLSNFEVTDLIVDAPFQRCPSSTADSVIEFTLADQGQVNLVECCVSWRVGLQPPSTPEPGNCEDPNIHIWFPSGTYNGTMQFQLSVSRQYDDVFVNGIQYNGLTKVADFNLTYPITPDYGCDVGKAHCESRNGSVITAHTTLAVCEEKDGISEV